METSPLSPGTASHRLQLRDEASLNILIRASQVFEPRAERVHFASVAPLTTTRSAPIVHICLVDRVRILAAMGGSSEAFREAGYAAPKPMIKIVGRPMLQHLIDNLQLRLGDVIWLILPAKLYAQYASQLDLNNEYPTVEFRVVTFEMMTRGVAETLFIGLQNMTGAELNRRALCLDCDTLYFTDVLGKFRALPNGRGACFYFLDTGTAAIYSYLGLAHDGSVQVRQFATVATARAKLPARLRTCTNPSCARS